MTIIIQLNFKRHSLIFLSRSIGLALKTKCYIWNYSVSVLMWDRYPIPQKSSGGLRKDKARPMVGVSSVSFLQCFDTVGSPGWQESRLAHTKSATLILKGSCPEQVEDQVQGLPEKVAVKWKQVGRSQNTVLVPECACKEFQTWGGTLCVWHRRNKL